jgi:hypothetical protein
LTVISGAFALALAKGAHDMTILADTSYLVVLVVDETDHFHVDATFAIRSKISDDSSVESLQASYHLSKLIGDTVRVLDFVTGFGIPVSSLLFLGRLGNWNLRAGMSRWCSWEHFSIDFRIHPPKDTCGKNREQ